MKIQWWFLCAVALTLAGCSGSIPFRSGALDEDASCAARYAAYDQRRNEATPLGDAEAEHPCWQRSVEEHPAYDLLIAEFSDQGWIHDTASLDRPAQDYLDRFLKKLREMHRNWAGQGQGLSLFVYVHGWHHDARAADADMVDFRRFLADMSELETTLSRETGARRRVLGIYVGWRGESIRAPGLNVLTFWDRKNTAERVALGSTRELLERLDYFRDRSRDKAGKRDVRMLTIGHSFGGLVTFAAMGPQFLRAAIRLKESKPGNKKDNYVSRVGDLVVIVNPAIEGARYEPLPPAGQRMCGVAANQRPVMVVATTAADWATGTFFPLARRFSTLLESSPGQEGDAVVKAVGHNERYITHELSLCAKGDASCAASCPVASFQPQSQAKVGTLADSAILREYRYMKPFADGGFGTRTYLCGGLDLRSTRQWSPQGNPFWVVRTTEDIMGGHGDIFNPNFVAFFRQLYLGFIHARQHTPPDGVENNPCEPES